MLYVKHIQKINQKELLQSSPYKNQIEKCIVYIDDAHTRGTDFVFPEHFRAVVTIGKGITKDKLVQSCMRMRKLGIHHYISFWASNEVDNELLKKNIKYNKE